VIIFNIFFEALSSVIFPYVLTIVLLPLIEPRVRRHLEGKLLYRMRYPSCICNVCLWRNNKPCTGLLQVEAPRYQDNWHMKMVILSALRTGRFHLPGNIHGSSC
jgi:hypothetical protein